MLAAAVQEQQLERARRRKYAELLRGEAKTAGVVLNRAVTDCVNHQARTVYDNQQLIEKETKALAIKTAKFERVASKWVDLFQDLNKEMEQLGDVEAWGRDVEGKLETIAGSLEYLAKVDRTL